MQSPLPKNVANIMVFHETTMKINKYRTKNKKMCKEIPLVKGAGGCSVGLKAIANPALSYNTSPHPRYKGDLLTNLND